MGIGAEICQRLGLAGYTVVVADRDMEAAKRRADELGDAGSLAAAQHIDAGDAASVEQAFAEIESRHARCDVLVNCAGIAKVFPFLEFPLENFQATMNVNLSLIHI